MVQCVHNTAGYPVQLCVGRYMERGRTAGAAREKFAFCCCGVAQLLQTIGMRMRCAACTHAVRTLYHCICDLEVCTWYRWLATVTVGATLELSKVASLCIFHLTFFSLPCHFPLLLCTLQTTNQRISTLPITICHVHMCPLPAMGISGEVWNVPKSTRLPTPHVSSVAIEPLTSRSTLHTH
jgi:hypothetical protein